MMPSFRAPVAEPFPGEFVVTRAFGDMSFPQFGPHDGLDIGNGRENDSVVAIASGIVYVAQFDPYSGGAGIVRIDHGNGWTSGYAHLNRINVRTFQNVNQGETIGLLGSTGWTTGAHLHFDITHNLIRQDPLPLLKRGTDMRLEKDKVGGLYGRSLTVNVGGGKVRRQSSTAAEVIVVLPAGTQVIASAVVTGQFVDLGAASGNQWYAVWVEENQSTLLGFMHDSTCHENPNAANDAARSQGYDAAIADALEAIRKL